METPQERVRNLGPDIIELIRNLVIATTKDQASNNSGDSILNNIGTNNNNVTNNSNNVGTNNNNFRNDALFSNNNNDALFDNNNNNALCDNNNDDINSNNNTDDNNANNNTDDTSINSNIIDQDMINFSSIRNRNKIHCTIGEHMEVIPFANDGETMPFEILCFQQIVLMSGQVVSRFLRGYNLSWDPRMSLTEKKIRLAYYLGVPDEIVKKSFLDERFNNLIPQ